MDIFKSIMTTTISVMNTNITFGTFTFSLLEWWLATCVVSIIAWFVVHVFD